MGSLSAQTRAVSLPPVSAAEGDLRKSPLWELGMGAGSTFTPDYPASDQMHPWLIPFPFGIYRGEIVHSDRRGGTRARFLKAANYEFNVSMGGGLPSSSSKNTARANMPNLEWLGEIGPRVNIDLYSRPSRSLLRFGIPIRAAYSYNFEHLRDQGYVLAPELLYDLPDILGSEWDAFLQLTVTFADRRFSNYFYGVEPAYATAERPAYVARSGYMGTGISTGLAIPLTTDRSLKLFTYLSASNHKGSANEASPLYRTDLNYSVSAVLIWIFAKSEVGVVPED